MASYEKILLAVDFSEATEQVADKARELAVQTGADLHAFHVVEPIIVDANYEALPVSSIELEEELVKRSRQQLLRLADRYGIAAGNIDVEVGTTKTTILKKAKALGADLIVIGSHGRHGVALLLGSTANAVLHGAPCDVLAVRIKA